MHMADRTLTADVLVIGGSGAGLCSAIFAAKQGAQVVVACKGKAARSGNAAIAGGGLVTDGVSARDRLGYPAADTRFTPDDLFDCLVKESYYLADQNVARQYVDELPAAMEHLLGWAEQAGETIRFTPKPARFFAAGLAYNRSLLHAARSMGGIRFVEDTAAADLLTADGRVSGALCIDVYTGEFVRIAAGAVVVASGGFQPFSFQNTVSDMTGDGPAMALRAGARLGDMEFLLAFPTAVVPQELAGSIYPFMLEILCPELDYRILDAAGIPLEIPEQIARATRHTKLSKLVSSYYMGHALRAGGGGAHGGLFYDYSVTPAPVREEMMRRFFDSIQPWYPRGHYKGEDLSAIRELVLSGGPLEVGVGFEYSMGGIAVDEAMYTGVPGLYAAGEATSGTFGACRVGDGLAEMLCQGMRAGISAAAAASSPPRIDDVQLSQRIAKHLRYFSNTGGTDASALFRRIHQVCDAGFGLIREEAGLTTALRQIRALREEHRTARVASGGRSYNLGWLEAVASENLLTCAEAGIRAALERRESRGCHMRADCPRVDHDRFLHKYEFAADADGELRISARRPVVTAMPLPSGGADDVLRYLFDPALGYSRTGGGGKP